MLKTTAVAVKSLGFTTVHSVKCQRNVDRWQLRQMKIQDVWERILVGWLSLQPQNAFKYGCCIH